jgi:cytochrome c-type biogenesis protein CcmH/NrfG
VYDPVIVEEFALLAVRSGHYHDALSVIEPFVRERGEANVPVSVLRAAAECMLALQRTEPARKLLGSVVEKNGNDVHAWLLLARCGIAMGDAHATRRAADNVRRLAPRDPQGMLLDAYARVQEGKLKAAELVLRQALRQNDHDALVYCMLGLVAERGNDPAAARTHYRAALRVDPACVWAQAALRRIEIVVPANGRPASEPDADGQGAVAIRAHTSEEAQ